MHSGNIILAYANAQGRVVFVNVQRPLSWWHQPFHRPMAKSQQQQRQQHLKLWIKTTIGLRNINPPHQAMSKICTEDNKNRMCISLWAVNTNYEAHNLSARKLLNVVIVGIAVAHIGRRQYCLPTRTSRAVRSSLFHMHSIESMKQTRALSSRT